MKSRKKLKQRLKQRPKPKLKSPKPKVANGFKDPPFRSIKVPLTSILRHPDRELPIFDTIAIQLNRTILLAYQLVRLYIIFHWEHKVKLPAIDEKLYETALSLVINTKRKIQKSIKMNDCRPTLKAFFNEHFRPLITDANLPKIKGVSNILQKLRVGMNTAFVNNLTIHYYKRLSRVLGVALANDQIYNHLENKEQKRIHANILNRVINRDLTAIEPHYQAIGKWVSETFVPGQQWEKHLAWDLVADPLKFLSPTLAMQQYLETRGHKSFQAIPLRTSWIPKYFPINTIILKSILDCKGFVKQKTELDNISTNSYLTHSLWNYYFKLDKKVFSQKGYKFAYSIDIDGFGCTLKFQRIGYQYRRGTKSLGDDWSPPKIADLTDAQRQELLNYHLVGADPGKGILLQLVGENRTTLRYTSRQRSTEARHTKYREIRLSMMNRDDIKTLEQSLNEENSMSVGVANFKKYITCKAEVGVKVMAHYQQSLYRKLGYRSRIRGKISMTKFINRIEQTFSGSPRVRPVALLYGNWSRSDQMKGIIPTPGMGLKRECAKQVRMLDIDEFGSSKYCAKCYSELRNWWADGEKLHRVLVCNKGCSDKQNPLKVPRFVHRDINGGQNHRNRGILELQGRPIPSVFCRSKVPVTNSTVQKSTDNPNSTLKKVPVIKKRQALSDKNCTTQRNGKSSDL